MTSRAEAASTRIREEIPILQVLQSYGYHVRADAGDREQQFSCDMHGTGRDNKPSARVYPASNSWYCVSVADRVLTDRGWVQLGDLASHPPKVLNGLGEFKTPIAYFDKGVRPCITLQTKAGYAVTLTRDHEVEVQGKGWIPADHVLPGDVLTIVRPVTPHFSTSPDLPYSVSDLNDQAFKGQRLGLKVEKVPQQRRVPSTLWGATQEAIRGFLREVFATDGSVFRPQGRPGVRVNLYSVSEGFLLDIQLLLLQFGIYSRICPAAKTRPGGVLYLQIATGSDILRFRDLIGIGNARKASVLESFQYNPRGARAFKAVVSRILDAGELPVADVSMPVEHSFVAGGIKVHNCFACDKTRDAIETVRAKEGVKFWEAVKLLEQAYGLDPLPIDYSETQEQPGAVSQLATLLDPSRTFEDDAARIQRYLDTCVKNKDLPLDQILRFWEAYDEISHHTYTGEWSQDKGRAMLQVLMQRIQQTHNEAACAGS